jgi:hypothetical protein
MKQMLAFTASATAAALIASAIASFPATAQPGLGFGFGPGYGMMQGSGYGMMPGYGPGRGRFTMLDANDDGVVSDEEAASAADEVFTAMDADDDGVLTQEEYMAVRMGPQWGYNAQRQAAMQKAKEERFASIDGDSDGKVSKEEFLAMAEAHHKAADADGNGRITPWEHRRQNWN